MKIEIELKETTEPQVFENPKKMFTWSMREGKVVYFRVLPVIAILPKKACDFASHANVVCLDGHKFWWATHCAEIPVDSETEGHTEA